MSRKLPPLSWLRTFEGVARAKSFVAAANDLALTPAAVSQHVRLLESWVGDQLFLRRRGGVVLTDSGQAILPSVTRALDGLEGGLDSVLSPRRHPSVTVRMPVAFAALWLIPQLAAFRAAHPGIAIRLQTEVWPSEVEPFNIDLEVRHGSGAWQGIAAERLSTDSLQAAARPTVVGKDAGEPKAVLDRLDQLATVVGYEEGWRTWLVANGLSQDLGRSATPVDSEMVAIAMAEAGGTAIIGRRPLFDTLFASGRLAPFGVPCPVAEGYYLVSPRGRSGSRAPVDRFAQWLRTSLADASAARPA